MRKLFSLVLVVFLFASQANSAIIYFDNSFKLGFGDDAQLTWDIDNNGSNDISNNPLGSGTLILGNNTYFPDFVSDNGIASVLEEDDLIDSDENFARALDGNASGIFISAGSINIGFFQNLSSNGTPQYLGFALNHDRDDTTDPLYGWLSISHSSGNNYFDIHQWAYEDSGSSIKVGDTGINIVIPEPATSSLALFALSAAGLRRLRKK